MALGDQIFEMRWKKGEEEIHLDTPNGTKIRMSEIEGEEEIVLELSNGVKLSLTQTPTVKITAETPGGFKVELDEAAQRAVIATPEQKVEMLDGGSIINIITSGNVELGKTGGTKKTLVNADFLTKYDVHTHIAVGTPATPTSGPTPTSVPLIDATIDTKAS